MLVDGYVTDESGTGVVHSAPAFGEVSVTCSHSKIDVFLLGCSRKNPHPPDGWDSGNSRGRGGQRLRKSRREAGLTLKKSSAGVISAR